MVKHNGLLTAILIFCFLEASLYFILFTVALYLFHTGIYDLVDIAEEVPFGLELQNFLATFCILSSLALISIVAIFKWKKWGIYLYVLYTIATLTASLELGMPKQFILPSLVIPILLLITTFSQWNEFENLRFHNFFDGFFVKVATSVLISITVSFITYSLGIGDKIDILSVSIGGIVFVTVSLLQS